MKNRPGSVVGSLILIGIGLLFLLGNFFPELRPLRLVARFVSDGWWLFARFWPVVIVLWGLSKLRSYLRSGQDPAIGRRSFLSAGDVVLLAFLLVFGTTATHLTKAWRGSKEGARWKGVFHFGEPDFDFLGSGHRFEFAEEITQPLKGKRVLLKVNNQHGSVEVLVHESPDLRVKLVKKVRAEDEIHGKEISDRLKIVIGPEDAGYALSTNRETLPEDWQRGLQTDLTIWVPRTTTLQVSNEFGQVSLDGISGSHEILNAHGPVTIKNVEGSLQVENKYGPVHLSAITGDCRVLNKYGPVEVESVGGKTHIENAYGAVELKKLKGPVDIENRYGRVSCRNLESSLLIDGKYVDVQGQDIGGDVEVVTSYKDIVLENVLGGIIVKGKHGDIAIRNNHPPVKSILIEAEYSGVAITLPKESHFDLDANSKHGKVVSNFRSGTLPESDSEKGLRIKSSTGPGGPSITVTTSYRDIAINPS